jgi:hypothetical protein
VAKRSTARTFIYDGFRWTVSVNGGMHFDCGGRNHFLPLPLAELPNDEQLRHMPEDQLRWLLHMASHGKRPSGDQDAGISQ